MELKDFEYKINTILGRLDSLEERVGSVEEKLNSMKAWKAVQDRMWEERDRMNGCVEAAISSIESKLDDLRDSVIKIQASQNQADKDILKAGRRANIYLALFAGLMMLGTLIVQIIMAAK